MLTAESLIAKAVTVLVSKAAGALATLAFDKRKRACRALIKLYYAVQSLDEATDQLLFSASSSGTHGSAQALIRGLVREQHTIEIATNAFIDLSNELERGLALLDPALAQLCRLIYRGKGDFLSFMSGAIEFNLRGDKAFVKVYRPNAKILSTDFESAYNQSKALVSNGGTYYWPSGAFDYFNDFEEIVVQADDDIAASELLTMIRNHHDLLKQAKEQLRNLLKQSFTVEELLFHNDSTPK